MVENFVKVDKPTANQTVIIESVSEKLEQGVKVTTNIYCGAWKTRAEAYTAFKNLGIRQKKANGKTYVYGLMKLSHLKDDGTNNYFEYQAAQESTGDVSNASV